MRNARVWRAVLGVEKTVVEGFEFEADGDQVGDEDDGGGADSDGVLIAHVRPAGAARGRCGVCQRRCARYDNGEGRRRWRGLDLGTVQVFLEADALVHAKQPAALVPACAVLRARGAVLASV